MPKFLFFIGLFVLFYSEAIATCKPLFAKQDRPLLQKKMREIRENFWEIEAAIKDLKRETRNEEAWLLLIRNLEEAKNLTEDFVLKAKREYVPESLDSVPSAEQARFLKSYKKAYKVLRNMVERFHNEALAQYESGFYKIEELERYLPKISGFSAKAHYKF